MEIQKQYFSQHFCCHKRSVYLLTTPLVQGRGCLRCAQIWLFLVSVVYGSYSRVYVSVMSVGVLSERCECCFVLVLCSVSGLCWPQSPTCLLWELWMAVSRREHWSLEVSNRLQTSLQVFPSENNIILVKCMRLPCSRCNY